mmetsp:Transcript_16168/g.27355  ORF Transcript_16168/g.27355 Transcript_16168/m.27355 type:complete len:149 (+) Transcript_16168:479-925(+)
MSHDHLLGQLSNPDDFDEEILEYTQCFFDELHFSDLYLKLLKKNEPIVPLVKAEELKTLSTEPSGKKQEHDERSLIMSQIEQVSLSIGDLEAKLQNLKETRVRLDVDPMSFEQSETMEKTLQSSIDQLTNTMNRLKLEYSFSVISKGN